MPLSSWTALAGSTYVEGPGDRIGFVFLKTHPQFDPVLYDFDAALLRLKRKPLYDLFPIHVCIDLIIIN